MAIHFGIFLRGFTAVAACAAAIGCSGTDSPTAPSTPPAPQIVAGVLAIKIEGVRPEDRALRFTVTGLSSAASVLLSQPGLALHARASGSDVSAAVFGQLAVGELASIAISNIASPPPYSVSLVEVADKNGALRPDSALGTYKLSIQRR